MTLAVGGVIKNDGVRFAVIVIDRGLDKMRPIGEDSVRVRDDGIVLSNKAFIIQPFFSVGIYRGKIGSQRVGEILRGWDLYQCPYLFNRAIEFGA